MVVDGGSTDKTVSIVERLGVRVLNCDRCGRSYQMNKGGAAASGELLYFVHSDTLPPDNFATSVREAVASGYEIGCFQSCFDSKRWLLKLNGFFSRFDRLWCRGGDQTLFVTKRLFDELDGYRPDMKIMEEYDFIIRARQQAQFKIIPHRVLVSARKYQNRSFFKVQFANLVVFNLFRFGASQERLVRTYRQLLG